MFGTKMASKISIKSIKELLEYNPETGELRWKLVRRPGRNVYGDVAGYLSDQNSLDIGLFGGKYRAHRIAWVIHYGRWPKGYIDHINGNRLDNRIANLRDVSKAGNQQNVRHIRSHNKSGFLGVVATYCGWKAQITNNGKNIYLGHFKTPQLAHEEYLRTKRKLHETNTL